MLAVPRSLRILNSRLERRCGTCQECCTAGLVPEIDKPGGVRCPSLRVGKPGCSVHGTEAGQPPTCATFRCLWLQGAGGDDHRPDRVGVFLTIPEIPDAPPHPGFPGAVGETLRGQRAGIVAVECWRGAARTSAAALIAEVGAVGAVGVVPFPENPKESP